MRICIVGLGYVGAVTSICFARDGHDVFGVDVDAHKIELIGAGQSPIIETGTQELTREVVEAGKLRVGVDLPCDLSSYDVVFVCVGTPSDESGAHSLGYVGRVAEQIGEALRDSEGYPVVVIRSTVLPGTTEEHVKPLLETSSGRQTGVHFGLCFQPEFLREGSSINDFDHPPLTVVGSDSPRSSAVVEALFEHLDAGFFSTDIRTAEMLKMACNAYHAVKISFANEIGRIGQSAGVDSRQMMKLLCEDTQLNISSAYLKPGFAFGGSCLPKDLRALMHMGRSRNLETPMLQGVLETNDLHIGHALKLIRNTGARRVALVGLSFKEGTDDLRESPSVALAERLIGKGFELQIYDPAVKLAQLIGSNKAFIESSLPHIGRLVSDRLDEVMDFGEVIVVAQKSQSVADKVLKSPKPIVDLVGLEPERPTADYAGLCW